MGKKKTTFISKTFELFIFVWLILSGGLVLVFRSGARQELKIILGKSGVNRLKMMRAASKRTANEMPYLIPVFTLIPGMVFFLAAPSLVSFAIGCGAGFGFLILFPLVFQAPSTMNNKAD
jgi:hypothetical protein